MTKYVIRRIIQAFPTLFGITLLSFLIMTQAPGGPTSALGIDPNTPQRQIEILRAQLGVDDPWYLQYVYWLVGDDWVRP